MEDQAQRGEGANGSIARDAANPLIRAMAPAIELRSNGTSGTPVMTGHFAVFDQWTEINSVWEGNFMERFAPGAFKKTIRDNVAKMRVLFQHGMDPQVGDKPLGPIDVLREDSEGALYEVPLLDAGYVRDSILPGLEAGLYGASFRFRVMREEIVDEPGASDANPGGLPERTVKEAQVMEFGPVTFPAYAGASAGVRSMTDDFIMRCFAQDPEKLRAMFEEAQEIEPPADDVATEDDVRYDDPSGEDVENAEAVHDAGASPHLVEKQQSTRKTSRPRLTSTWDRDHNLNPQKGWKLP